MMQIITDSVLSPAGIAEESENISLADVGIAVDIGTTTVVVSACSRKTGMRLAVAADRNAQTVYGSDVIQRIDFALRSEGAQILHRAIIEQLEKLITAVLLRSAERFPRGVRPSVVSMVVTGNTTMLSLFAGVSVAGLSAAPFTPGSFFDNYTTWGEIRKSPGEKSFVRTASVMADGTPVYLPPCIGAFVGADAVCSMLATGFSAAGTSPLLLADIGTNCELCLFIPENQERPAHIVCTAAAAGPAFEAANIACGMSALPGAIDYVSIDENGHFVCHVIGDGVSRGICGSGLLSVVAACISAGYVEKSGMIVRGSMIDSVGMTGIQLTPSVYVLQQDIRNLQLAKSALATAIQYLLEKSYAVPVFRIAGGFGSMLALNDAAVLGLFPEKLVSSAVQTGNASLAGAEIMLFSPAQRLHARTLAEMSIEINLAGIPDFQKHFVAALDF